MTAPTLALSIVPQDIFNILGSVFNALWPFLAIAAGIYVAMFLLGKAKGLVPKK